MSKMLWAAVVTVLTMDAAQAAPKTKMAVLPTFLDPSAKDIPRIIDDYVLTAVQSVGTYDVIGADDIDAVLGFEKQKEMVGCDDSQCFAAIGGALGVQKLLSLRVARVGNQWATSAKILDIRGEPKVESRSADFIPGDAAALLAATPGIINKLINGGGVAAGSPSATIQNATSVQCQQADACYDTGDDFYYARNGRQKDFTQAAAYFERSCTLGDVRGCNDFGYMLKNGEGVARDYALALKLLTQACDAKRGGACNSIGTMYDVGDGVTQSDPTAFEFFGKGCELESARACTNQGIMYANAEGRPADAAQAAVLYKKGCDGEHAEACQRLGKLYETGSGVSQDWNEAKRYFQLGCDYDEDDGCTALKQFEPRYSARGCAGVNGQSLALLLGTAALLHRWRRRRRAQHAA